MKITFSRAEVEQIILNHANAMTCEGLFFNTLETTLYSSSSFMEVSFQEPAPVQVEHIIPSGVSVE